MTACTTASLSFLAIATAASCAQAQLSIPWFTIDGGGGVSSGGSFSLSGTIGQHDAGPQLAGGAFALTGGFWPGATAAPFCPADFNGDGTTDPDDLADFITAFFSVPPAPGSDFNNDGATDPDDLADFIIAFFSGC